MVFGKHIFNVRITSLSKTLRFAISFFIFFKQISDHELSGQKRLSVCRVLPKLASTFILPLHTNLFEQSSQNSLLIPCLTL